MAGKHQRSINLSVSHLEYDGLKAESERMEIPLARLLRYVLRWYLTAVEQDRQRQSECEARGGSTAMARAKSNLSKELQLIEMLERCQASLDPSEDQSDTAAMIEECKRLTTREPNGAD